MPLLKQIFLTIVELGLLCVRDCKISYNYMTILRNKLYRAKIKMTNYQIKLIYILGSGHSGSTLTDLILGSHSSIESVGELFQLPEYVSPDSNRADDRRICTCGVHISKFPSFLASSPRLQRKNTIN